MDSANSVADWLRLVEQHRITAVAVAEDKVAAGQALFHVGLAVECALKAYIMHVERPNSWPSKSARPDLYTHDLRALARIAQLQVGPRDPHAASWSIVMQWDRNQGYDPNPMPRRVARSWVDAAFGPDGVVTWISQKIPVP